MQVFLFEAGVRAGKSRGFEPKSLLQIEVLGLNLLTGCECPEGGASHNDLNTNSVLKFRSCLEPLLTFF